MHKHHFSRYHSINQVNFARQNSGGTCGPQFNGPQFSTEEFDKFAKECGFQHKPSSSKFPQANGEAERAVKTVKTI